MQNIYLPAFYTWQIVQFGLNGADATAAFDI
jgi:hypothetical protein